MPFSNSNFNVVYCITKLSALVRKQCMFLIHLFKVSFVLGLASEGWGITLKRGTAFWKISIFVHYSTSLFLRISTYRHGVLLEQDWVIISGACPGSLQYIVGIPTTTFDLVGESVIICEYDYVLRRGRTRQFLDKWTNHLIKIPQNLSS